MKINLTPEILHEKTKDRPVNQSPSNHNMGEYSMVSQKEWEDHIEYIYNGHIISHYDLCLINNIPICRLFKLKDGYGATLITKSQLVAEIELP